MWKSIRASGADAAVPAPSSGDEPAPPRHRRDACSMAWRTTRRFRNAPQHFDLHTGEYKPHSFSRSGLYKPASVGPLQEHTDYFSSLPQIDEPEIFGMHENANITFNRAESSTLMSSILALQPREGGGGGGKSSDEIVIDVIDDAEERMPALLEAVWKSTSASGAVGRRHRHAVEQIS